MDATREVMRRCGFHPCVIDWFEKKYRRPSPPQRDGWPVISSGQNTLILAPTGSGKTLTAFMWSIDQLYRRALTIDPDHFHKNESGVHTLYISPLKALNNDIHVNLKQPLSEIRTLTSDTFVPAIRAAVRTGDTPAHVRQSMVKTPPHILITTPESLYLMLTAERGRLIFQNLKYVIVDEIHALSGNKRGVHLSLTLERLEDLCIHPPVRIGLSATQKPMEKIAAFLGGYRLSQNGNWQARPVQIVDCGQKKDMDLRVIAPVADFSNLPDGSVWQPAYELLYDYIMKHKTTLIFVNMRSQTEKTARNLNELHRQRGGPGEIALAHHGSLSRETRHDIEERLKKGKIPAVIATGSLELGIDIGSVELVIQLEAPRSVAGALQRVGRSGHLLEASSKGRIVVMYPGGADDALALAGAMQRGDIETTHIPENALDILAQQITAETAMQSRTEEDLFYLVRCSYCYHQLSRALFDRTLDLLAGRYGRNSLQFLQPRISRDRVNGIIRALRGARMMATLNGGSIPDRGYFAVRLPGSNVLLGEVEEEFVYETKPGDTFFLGNSEWRLREVRQDRVLVEPVAAISPKAPFWKGDILFRELDTSRHIARFRRDLVGQLEKDDAEAWLKKEFPCDSNTRQVVRDYFNKQLDQTGAVGDDRCLLAEVTHGEGGQPALFVHAPLGARITGLYAILTAGRLEQLHGIQIQYAFDDDGFMMRLPESVHSWNWSELLSPGPEEAYRLLLKSLPGSPVFSVRFRYNAARSLILPRSRPGERIPLWLQRLRAADLLQTVQHHPDFPLMMETMRDCLRDVFDWQGLKDTLQALRRGEVVVRTVQTRAPSAMAAGPLFKFISAAMYEYDQKRSAGREGQDASALLNDLLNEGQPPALKNRDGITEFEQRQQGLLPGSQAGNGEELMRLIQRLGPITTAELTRRSASPPDDWLSELKADRRIVLWKHPPGWIDAQDRELLTPPWTMDKLNHRLRRRLQISGPRTLEQLAGELMLPEKELMPALEDLQAQKMVVRGRLLADADREWWCDRQNFAMLYRRQMGRARHSVKTGDRGQLYRFILAWQGLAFQRLSPQRFFNRYRGYGYPIHFLQREMLPARFQHACPKIMEDFSQSITRGERILLVHPEGSQLRYFNRGEGGWLLSDSHSIDSPLSDTASQLFQFIAENGASYLRDAGDALGFSAAQLSEAAAVLLRMGRITAENDAVIYNLLSKAGESGWTESDSTSSRQMNRSGRRMLEKQVRESVALKDTRWLTSRHFAVMGKKLGVDEITRRQTMLLLERYGVLVKEWYRQEKGMLPWYGIFTQLKKLEWQGVIRRGYFFEGLSGVQFALPEAADLLMELSEDDPDFHSVLLSTADPALPLGRQFPWDLKKINGEELRVVRAAANHLYFYRGAPAAYLEQYASRVWCLKPADVAMMNGLIATLKTRLSLPAAIRPVKAIRISAIDDKPASRFSLVERFIKDGFENEGDELVLWPSRL